MYFPALKTDCGAADAGTPDLCLLPLVQLLLLLRWSLQCCPWAAAHQSQFYLYFFCEIDCWAKTFTFSTSSLVSAHSFISPESKVPLRLGVFYIWNKLGPIQMLMLTSSVFRWWEGSHFNLMTQTHLCCKVLLPQAVSKTVWKTPVAPRVSLFPSYPSPGICISTENNTRNNINFPFEGGTARLSGRDAGSVAPSSPADPPLHGSAHGRFYEVTYV